MSEVDVILDLEGKRHKNVMCVADAVQCMDCGRWARGEFPGDKLETVECKPDAELEGVPEEVL